MKLFTATSLFAAIATIDSATSSSADIKFDVDHIDIEQFALALADKGLLLPGHSIDFDSNSTMYGGSAECHEENEVLLNNTDLMAASEALTNACPPTSNDATSTVTAKWGAADCSSVGEVQRTCTAAGGTRITALCC